MSHRIAAALLTLIASCTLAVVAHADTLGQIKKSGEIRLGYRTDAPPMSFTDAKGQPAGYSVELCRRIAAAVKEELKLDNLKITMVPLSNAERIDAIVNNKADIECGSTTITLSRQKLVDFTSMTFVTGGSVLSHADSGIDSIAKLAGKSVAVVKGTTSETALKEYLSKNLIDAKVVVAADRDDAMKQLESKQVDASRGRPGRPNRVPYAVGESRRLQAEQGPFLVRAVRAGGETQRRRFPPRRQPGARADLPWGTG